MWYRSRRLNRSFCTALSLLLAACVRPVISGCPQDYACRNTDNAGPRLPQGAGSDDVIRTTAARPAINLGTTPINLARTRLSLHPVTGAAAPVDAGNSEAPTPHPAANSGAQSP
jgi:hypothetical protein